MNKNTLLFAFCLALITITKAQIPPLAFNYSAVARNAQSNPIANQTIGIQITIIKTSPTGTAQYQENHFVNTDQFGLFNLVVGAGAVQSGSMATVDWSTDNYYLKVGMDANGGSNFLTMGTTQLLSVPYALFAKSAGSVGSGGATNLVLPTITTNAVTGITSNSATFGGSINNANGNQIVKRGIVYSTSPNPTYYSNTIDLGSGIGSFDTISGLSSQISDGGILSPNTTYFVRAFAVTENNIYAYGNEVSFTTLSVGQIGPGGGLVFFDKGNNTGGWQYLESAPNDQSTGISWGCKGTSIPGTQQTVGSGEVNTSLIVAGCNDASFAAKLCDNLSLGGQSDWFLPSRDELNLMRVSLHLNGQGNFNILNPYWSSSENSSSNAYPFTAFGNGISFTYDKNSTYYVRAVRAF